MSPLFRSWQGEFKLSRNTMAKCSRMSWSIMMIDRTQAVYWKITMTKHQMFYYNEDWGWQWMEREIGYTRPPAPPTTAQCNKHLLCLSDTQWKHHKQWVEYISVQYHEECINRIMVYVVAVNWRNLFVCCPNLHTGHSTLIIYIHEGTCQNKNCSNPSQDLQRQLFWSLLSVWIN